MNSNISNPVTMSLRSLSLLSAAPNMQRNNSDNDATFGHEKKNANITDGDWMVSLMESI